MCQSKSSVLWKSIAEQQTPPPRTTETLQSINHRSAIQGMQEHQLGCFWALLSYQMLPKIKAHCPNRCYQLYLYSYNWGNSLQGIPSIDFNRFEQIIELNKVFPATFQWPFQIPKLEVLYHIGRYPLSPKKIDLKKMASTFNQFQWPLDIGLLKSPTWPII